MAIAAGDRISNVPFREAFEKQDLTFAEFAYRLGWVRPSRDRKGRAFMYADEGRARRVLGYKSGQEWVTVETATALAEALGFDPVDFGF